MAIALSKEDITQAIESLQRYFDEHFDEPLGNLPAQSLLDFVVREIGPAVYNQAVRDVQARLQTRVAELDIEIHEDEFQYWRSGQRRSR